MEQKKVATFDLNDPIEKHLYEDILNKYPVIREEFAYMKDGTPKVTVWYVVSEE